MKSLNTGISKATALMLLAGFFIVLVVIDSVIKSNLQNQILYDLRIQAQLSDLLLSDSTSVMTDQVTRLSVLAEARVTVMDETGRVLAESDPAHSAEQLDNHLNRPEIQGALRDVEGFGHSFRYSETVREELAYVAYKSDKNRFIRLAKKQAFINSIVWKVRWTILAVGLLTAIGLLLVVPRVTRKLTSGLTDIVKASEEIRKGNYEQEIVVHEPKEVADLALTLNAMSSKLKEDIQELKLMQDIRKDFVANASHELKTPITSIRGYLETLLEGAYHDEEVSKKFLDRTMANVVRLENIVNDMLDLSMLESREHGLSLRYIDIGAMMTSIVSDYTEAAHQKGLQLRTSMNLPPEFKFMADPYQLEKALINLVDNAIKYTEKGSVGMIARLESGSVEVLVEDTGPGIPTEDQKRIFERFYRVDKGRSRQLGGSGLGLSIVKHVMEMHKGEIRLESDPGKGSRFILVFPALT